MIAEKGIESKRNLGGHSDGLKVGSEEKGF